MTTAVADRPAEDAHPLPGDPIPQHLVLVLPSTGEFDSRAYRIARAVLSRGHTVTMLARWKQGLADEEVDPLGYRILRVHASSADGVPFQPLVRAGGRLARRYGAWRRGGRAADPSMRPSGGSPPAPDRSAAGSGATRPVRGSPLRRLWNWGIRRLAIPLTLRSHTRNARKIAPRGDLFHGMAYMGIPIALDLGRRDHAPVVYDARDIYLEARNLAESRGIVRYLAARGERAWAHRASRVVSVNEAYATIIAERLRVEKPLVVMNCSYRTELPEPRERRFHQRFGLAPERKVVLYHGGLFPHRGVEQLLTAMTELEGVTLVLMGYGVLEPDFRARAAGPDLADRVRMMGAVPPAELIGWVACADVVAMPIQPSTLNHRLTTPNKLFEAMTAGVPSVASDLPGMAAIVRETGCGVLVDPSDPIAIAAAIRGIVELSDADWQAWRARCLAAAHGTYNWEAQVGRLLDEYSRLTGRRW